MISNEIVVYVDNIKCKANRINVTCYESYNISNDDIEAFVVHLRRKLRSEGFEYTRSYVSWVKEIYAHNVLYRRNIWTLSTKDTDLTDGEEWYRLLFFSIIFVLGNIKQSIISLFKK